MKKALSKLFELRQALDACEKDIGLIISQKLREQYFHL